MEVKYSKITKLSEKLFQPDCYSLTTLKRLKGSIEKLCEVTHFRKINGLKNLIKFIDVKDCQSISLSLLGNCCVEEESSIYIAKINITSKLLELLSESKETYISKCVSRILGLMCMHQSCFHSVLMTPRATKLLVKSLCSHQLDKVYLQVHLKTIKIMSKGRYKNEMMYEGITCHLSSLLRYSIFKDLSKEILKLIYHFLIGKWKDGAESHDKCHLTLKILVGIVNEIEDQEYLVKNFIIQQLLLLPTLWRYFGSSGVLKLLLDSLKDSQCYKQKFKLLQGISNTLSEAHNRGCFKMEGGCEVMMEYLEDPLMRPSYSIILNILYHFTNDSLGRININFLSTISLCFSFIKEYNVSNVSLINSKFLYNGEILLFEDEELEKTPESNSFGCDLDISPNNDDEVPTKKIKLNNYTMEKLQDQECREKYSSKLGLSALKFLSGAAKKTTLQTHFEKPDRINVLTRAISTFPHNQNLHEIFLSLSYNPIFFQLLLSKMVVPSIHLMSTIHPNQPIIHSTFSKLIRSMTEMVHQIDIPFDIRKLISSTQSRLTSIMLLCYITKSTTIHTTSHFLDPLSSFLSRNILFGKKEVMAELIQNMYNQHNHVRLLTITSYCYLISTIKDSCECRPYELVMQQTPLKDKDFDVNFVVANELMRSVKSRLMHHSDVFTAMFEGSYMEASGSDVVITDSSPEAFRLFNQILLSDSFNCIDFKDIEYKRIIEVMQLSNKYLVRGLEDKIVNMIRSNLSAFFEELLDSNCLLTNRPLLVCCLLHVCKQVSRTNNITNSSVSFQTSKTTLKSFLYILTLFSQHELTDISTRLIKSSCIHKV